MRFRPRLNKNRHYQTQDESHHHQPTPQSTIGGFRLSSTGCQRRNPVDFPECARVRALGGSSAGKPVNLGHRKTTPCRPFHRPRLGRRPRHLLIMSGSAGESRQPGQPNDRGELRQLRTLQRLAGRRIDTVLGLAWCEPVMFHLFDQAAARKRHDSQVFGCLQRGLLVPNFHNFSPFPKLAGVNRAETMQCYTRGRGAHRAFGSVVGVDGVGSQHLQGDDLESPFVGC